MQRRPKSITIVAYYLVIGSVVGLMVDLMSPIFAQRVGAWAGAFVGVMCGVAILKRKNWARFFYVICNFISLCVYFFASSKKIFIIPSFLFLGLIAYFLFCSQANEYFEEPLKK